MVETVSSAVIGFRCVGYLFQKVGKVAATSVGGGLLLLQVLLITQSETRTSPDAASATTRLIFPKLSLDNLGLFFLILPVDRQPHWLYQSRLEESREGRQQGKEAVEAGHQTGRPGAQYNGGKGTICCPVLLYNPAVSFIHHIRSVYWPLW